MQSQLLILRVEPVLAMIMANFDFSFLGRDLKLKVQSFKLSRPEWMKKRQSTLGWISNSEMALLSALFLYFGSYAAFSLKRAIIIRPECITVIFLKTTTSSGAKTTFTQGPLFPIIKTSLLLSSRSKIRPGFVIALVKVYTPSARKMLQFGGHFSTASSMLLQGPFIWSTIKKGRSFSKLFKSAAYVALQVSSPARSCSSALHPFCSI